MSHTRITHEQYQEKVKILENQLDSACTVDDQKLAIARLRELDMAYVSSLHHGAGAPKHVMFTRHGHCSPARKHFGLNPNASVAPGALEAMRVMSDKITPAFLVHGDSPQIYISPMLRAKQTASAIIPANLDNKPKAEFSLALLENSQYPSGFFIESADELDVYAKAATDRREGFIKRVMFKLASIFYRGKFEEINAHSDEANNKIDDKSQDSVESVGLIDEIDSAGKISAIQQMIAHSDEAKDLWLIGHGKNFNAFFAAERGSDSRDNRFTYAETKQIIYYKNLQGKTMPFFPPYSLVISQQNGMVQSKRGMQAAKKNQNEIKKSRIQKAVLIGLGILVSAALVASVVLTAGASIPLIGAVAGGVGFAASTVGAAFGVTAAASVTLPVIGATVSIATIVGAVVLTAAAGLATAAVSAVSGLVYHSKHPEGRKFSLEVEPKFKSSYASHPILLESSSDFSQSPGVAYDSSVAQAKMNHNQHIKPISDAEAFLENSDSGVKFSL